MGLNARPVPTRVTGPAKQALLELAGDVVKAGSHYVRRRPGCRSTTPGCWPGRPAPPAAKISRTRRLGPVTGEVLHALLDWEKDAIIALAAEWDRIDLSHRKLAHRGSRLDRVFVSELSVLRVLTEAGIRLPGLPRPPARERSAFPDWAELVPGVVWVYDFTHFSGLPGWSAIAVIDVVSKYCWR